MLVVTTKKRMMRRSWVVGDIFNARQLLAANSRTATMMQYNLSHVESHARAVAVAEAEAEAGGDRVGGDGVLILCGGHATKSSEKMTYKADYAGA